MVIFKKLFLSIFEQGSFHFLVCVCVPFFLSFLSACVCVSFGTTQAFVLLSSSSSVSFSSFFVSSLNSLNSLMKYVIVLFNSVSWGQSR